MEPLKIIMKYYRPDSKAFYFLIEHSRQVMQKALDIAFRLKELKPDLDFIAEASLLHDIGIVKCSESSLDCHGVYPYIAHGYLGREMLEAEGLLRHALVCERHVGLGLTASEIIAKDLPLPHRDMMPVSIEEKIICLADKFYSKVAQKLHFQKPVDLIREEISRYAPQRLKVFDEWLVFFKVL